MSNENDLKTRLVPAICTQCGAALEVDPTQEAAVCRYCNTHFIVDKAIQKYTIEQANIEKIEHVDTVNINTKSTAESFFSFLGKQMSESREVCREERREWRAEERESRKAFFKLFGILCIAMMVFALIMFVVQILHGDWDTTEDEESYVEETAVYNPGDQDLVFLDGYFAEQFSLHC